MRASPAKRIESILPAWAASVFDRRFARLQRRRLALLQALLGVSGWVDAASWDVSPVRLELSTGLPTAAITIRNNSDQPSSLQIVALAWTQLDGKDIYTPTRELLVSPPIVTLPPQGEQVVRTALRRPADPFNELAYRISLQELPIDPVAGKTGVNVSLRIGLPVFVQALGSVPARTPVFALERLSDQDLKVTLHNPAGTHLKISDFALFRPGREGAMAEETVPAYVLPGQTRTWVLKTKASDPIGSGPLHLKAFTDAGQFDADLAIGAR